METLIKVYLNNILTRTRMNDKLNKYEKKLLSEFFYLRNMNLTNYDEQSKEKIYLAEKIINKKLYDNDIFPDLIAEKWKKDLLKGFSAEKFLDWVMSLRVYRGDAFYKKVKNSLRNS